jgi:hypothetical protein
LRKMKRFRSMNDSLSKQLVPAEKRGALFFAPNRLLQRKCACGGTPGASGECEACRKKRLQRQSANAISEGQMDAIAPSLVHEVLRSPGRPLDRETRAFMEPRFGRDFSQVRLHTDGQAATSAHEVNALAYTVGEHIVMGQRQYAPRTNEGRRLLAHELAHVIQQSGRLRRSAIAVEANLKVAPADDVLEREANDVAAKISEDESLPKLRQATSARLQRQLSPHRQPAIVGLADAGPKARLADDEKNAELLQCIKTLGPDSEECDPTRTLSWADFTGTPSVGSQFGAVTSSSVNPIDVPSQVCMERVLGKTASPTRRFRAKFDSGGSWVLPSIKDASDPNKNGCPALVSECVNFFKGSGSGSWALRPDGHCAAGVPPRGDIATSAKECVTKVGADCNDMKVADSARLLKHEQNHFNISCVFAQKANAALQNGQLERPIHKAVIDKRTPTQTLYDNETHHGCEAAKQAAWETNIAAGLNDIAIP